MRCTQIEDITSVSESLAQDMDESTTMQSLIEKCSTLLPPPDLSPQKRLSSSHKKPLPPSPIEDGGEAILSR